MNLFGQDGHLLLWWQECARAALVFGYGLLLVRLAGRRVFGKWSALDFIVSIVIGSNLSRTVTGNAPLLGTLAATAVLMALHALLAFGAARWPRVSDLVEGRPIDLTQGGELDEGLLRRRAISRNDLEEALRAAGIEAVGEAQRVVLEPSGKIAAVKAKG